MSTWENVPGRGTNLRGPLRSLTFEEQLEIHRKLREARVNRKLARVAKECARAYGVSLRTVYRYAHYDPLPERTEFLRMRLMDWAKQRDIRLTYDDMQTLLMAVLTLRGVGAVAQPTAAA